MAMTALPYKDAKDFEIIRRALLEFVPSPRYYGSSGAAAALDRLKDRMIELIEAK